MVMCVCRIMVALWVSFDDIYCGGMLLAQVADGTGLNYFVMGCGVLHLIYRVLSVFGNESSASVLANFIGETKPLLPQHCVDAKGVSIVEFFNTLC